MKVRWRIHKLLSKWGWTRTAFWFGTKFLPDEITVRKSKFPGVTIVKIER